jgi:hypothetical protein
MSFARKAFRDRSIAKFKELLKGEDRYGTTASIHVGVAARGATAEQALAAPKDLRSYLQKLIEHDPKQLMVVEKEIEPDFRSDCDRRSDAHRWTLRELSCRVVSQDQRLFDPAADKSARNV